MIQEYLAHCKKGCCDVFPFVKIECFSVEGENDVKTTKCAQDVFSMESIVWKRHKLERGLKFPVLLLLKPVITFYNTLVLLSQFWLARSC